jgi:hypothetical protein
MIARFRASPAARRLLWFVAGIVLLMAGLEWLERRHSTVFAAATHRGLTKVAMFERHPRVSVLFLGTSRTQDGVSPDLVTRAIARVAPNLGDVPGFNAAFTGSSLDALVALAPRFEGRTDVRLAVIELSDPQVFNDPAPWAAADRPPANVEERLGGALQRVAIVRYRKALIGANLGRLPSMFAAASLGGWETKGGEQLASWLGQHEAAAANFDAAQWQPEVITGPAATLSEPDADARRVASQLAALAMRYRTHGITTVFAVPPMAASEREAPERQGLRALFGAVARQSGSDVWNFASLALPDAFFRDPSHLNREGRAQYSEALARQIARVLAAGRAMDVR